MLNKENQSNQNHVSSVDLLSILADSSGYLKYEVEDVMRHLAYCVTRLLKLGSKVDIEGIGTFSRRESKDRTFKSAFNSVEYKVSTKISATLKPDRLLKNALNSKD